LFLAIGGVEALIMSHSAHAFAQRLRFITGSLQTRIVAQMHGTTMIFFFVAMPVLFWICELLGPIDDWVRGTWHFHA